jgi:hypothetical protein
LDRPFASHRRYVVASSEADGHQTATRSSLLALRRSATATGIRRAVPLT